MNTHADKTHRDENQSGSNADPQKQSDGMSTSQFADNRPNSAAQRKLKDMVTNSPAVNQLKAFQKMVERGASPAQRRGKPGVPSNQINSKRTINTYGGVLSPNVPSTSAPVQLLTVGDTHTLEGVSGQVHWHYSYDPANINSLHLTIADTRNYANRTWASRQSYTPTGTNSGNWTGWQNNHGQTPGWATQLAGNQGRGPAEQAFHADQAVALALRNAFPQAVPGDDAFPPLGAATAAPRQVQQPQQQQQQPQAAPALIGGIPASDAQHLLGSLLNDL